MSDFASFQNEIYLRGMAGVTPDLPMTYAGLRDAARATLSAEPYAYVAGSAGHERTADDNERAFSQHRLVPRHMVDVSERDLSTEVLGTAMPAPLMLAPIGVQSIIHPDGELASTRAAASLGLTTIVSTASSHTLEAVAEVAGDAPRWFQLYWPSDPAVAQSFVRRAEEAGYDAIVVTLDTKLLAWRPRDLTTAYLPFLQEQGIANWKHDPAFSARLAQPWDDDPQMALLHWIGTFADHSITWQDLEVLREATDLPIVLKGILHPDDARTAVQHGVDALIVSNHGGRQVDNAVPAIEMLPHVVDAVGDLPVLFDSGIRTGSDALVALCLGARAVCLGRPWAFGLALAGEDGVRHVLRSILADLDLTMALTGQTSIRTLGRHLLR